MSGKLGKSLVEHFRRGGEILIEGKGGHAVNITPTQVWLRGCDCSEDLDIEGVRGLHEALGAWLRINGK